MYLISSTGFMVFLPPFHCALYSPFIFFLSTKVAEAMFALHHSTGILLLLLVNGLMIHDVHAGIGLKPLDFFRLGGSELDKEVAVVFHPDEGLRLRENFEKKYGIRGEELIKSLGGGGAPLTGNDKKT